MAATLRLFAWALALLAAPGAGALTLADLVAGETIVTEGGVVYSGFHARVKGHSLVRDLSRYEVSLSAWGFQISGDAATGRRGDGRLVLKYSVAVEEDLEVGITSTSVSVSAGSDPDTMVKNKHKLYDDGKRPFAVLFAQSMPGMDELSLELDELAGLRVVDTIRVWGRFADGAQTTIQFCTPIPEPGTAALVVLGAAALGARRRGERCSRPAPRQRLATEGAGPARTA